MPEPLETYIRVDLNSGIPFFSVAIDNYINDLHDETNMQIFDEQVKFWKEIPNIISSARFETQEFGEIKLELDWDNVIKYLQKWETRKYAECYPSPPDGYYHGFGDYDEDSTTIFCKLSISNGVQKRHNLERIISQNYFYPFLYQVFLALNLSSPGCFNLHRSQIKIDEEYSSHLIDKLNLSDEIFAGAFHQASKLGKWPTVSSISLAQTWTWLQSLNINTKPIAHSAMEKVLFALLHACEQEYAPHQVMWLSIALEALFDTSPETAIGKTLRNRSFLVLDEPSTHKKNAKKLISDFYSLRSSLVHGSLEVMHPTPPYFYTDEIRKYYDQFREPIALATSLILATLQKCIANNWLALEFTETYEGRPRGAIS